MQCRQLMSGKNMGTWRTNIIFLDFELKFYFLNDIKSNSHYVIYVWLVHHIQLNILICKRCFGNKIPELVSMNRLVYSFKLKFKLKPCIHQAFIYSKQILFNILSYIPYNMFGVFERLFTI